MLSASTPYLVATPASVRHEAATETGTLARLAAEVAGDVVGLARVRDHGERRMLMVQVTPSARGAGVGRALLERALPVAADGAVGVGGIVSGDDASQSAAVAWGFTLGRRQTMAAVDPRTVVADDGADDGACSGVVPLAGVDPAAVHACYAATAGDDPSGLSRADPFDVFVRARWHLPTHRPDLGRAVLADDGRVLALALINAAGDRAWNAFTGTHPDARGRGLARRVKTASLVALAGAGVTRCATGNDDANAPMLAVNARLGYAPIGWTRTAFRTV